ncbi:MAG TPA: hypothetical protein VIV40_17565 [Kofleriaceae bacterium]
MPNVDADIEVQRFGYAGDDQGRRLLFPHAQTHKIEGRSGHTAYGANDCTFEHLEGRLDTLRWQAESASIGSAWLRNDAGTFDVHVERAELPHGIRLVRAADANIELLAPNVTFSELRLTFKGPFGRTTPAAAPAPEPNGTAERQEKLRFLDSLSGRIYTTLKVQLDLPVLGVRTLDQQLRVPIQEGSLDYRALEDSLDWLEGTFLDLKLSDQRLKVQWKVPIFGSGHDLITWALDTDAATLASFGRVPVRSLADFRLPSSNKPPTESEIGRRRGVLKAFTLDKIEVALSLLAPRHLEVGGGTIMFGGEDQPGMVDLKVSGAIRDRGAGALKGAIGSVDTTIKDLKLGSTVLSADRLHFDGVDLLEVEFDGFHPTAVHVVVHRVTATNLSIKIGEPRHKPPTLEPPVRSSTPA